MPPDRTDPGSLPCLHATVVICILVSLASGYSRAESRRSVIELRGHRLELHLYGKSTGDPLIVSSGDGGFVHLAPTVSELLAERGFFVVGVDSKAYLSSFTHGEKTLSPQDVPRDFGALIEYASRESSSPPLLVGVSLGAGLSVLAATEKENQDRLAGVIGLGLPDVNELAWRFRDSIIYLTKKVPNEPTFSVGSIVAEVSPLPLAAIHATQDEFVPLSEVESLMKQAREPKKLWVIDAPNHRFGGREDELIGKLLEAIEWIRHSRTEPVASKR